MEAEVEAHWRANHGVYRNWCPICVKARGKDLDHRADAGEERGLSEYAFDYAFPGDEFGHQIVTLVGSERKTGAVMAVAVPMKGSSGRYSVDKVLDFMEEVGDQATAVIVKTDQENAIVSGLIDDVVQAREDGRTLREEACKYSSGSNGRVERAVLEVEGQMRAIVLAFEERVGEQVDPKEPIAQFIPEFAAFMLNRLKVGKDGKTAAERCKGKRATVVGLGVGEKLLWRRIGGRRLEKCRGR